MIGWTSRVRMALAAGVVVWVCGHAAAASAKVSRAPFGRTPEGQEVELFTLVNEHGVTAQISTLGATLTTLRVADRHGRLANVVLGFDNLAQYLAPQPSFGATVGRVANRIAGAQFVLDGKTYQLAANDGTHHLHGGARGFGRVVWKGEPKEAGAHESAVELTYLSKAGEEGYPGDLLVKVVYTLSDDDALRIDYTATTTAATPVNLTNHSYFNLQGWGDVLNHELTVAATAFTPTDASLIPTGQVSPVAGTPLDFSSSRRIGARIDQLKPEPGGYDHNFVLTKGNTPLALAARLVEPNSGRTLEVSTSEPGMQIFTANIPIFDKPFKGVDGVAYGRHSGICFETQHFPDSVHHSNFPTTILRPGEKFASTTLFQFGVQKS